MSFFWTFNIVYVLGRLLKSFFLWFFFLQKVRAEENMMWPSFKGYWNSKRKFILFYISKKREYKLPVEKLYGSLFWECDKHEFMFSNFTNFTFQAILFFHLPNAGFYPNFNN